MIEPSNLDTLLHPQFDAEGAQGSKAGRQRRWLLLPALPAARSYSPLKMQRLGAAEGRKGRPGSSGDLSGGYRRHEGCAGHPDRSRRHDLPRSCCCARHGHLLRFRLRRLSTWMKRTRSSTLGGKTYHEGDCISIDGSTGNIYDGAHPDC